MTMRYTLFDRLSCWFHNSVIEPFSRRHDRKKKTHYECCVCGMLEAPYFYDGSKYTSMQHDYGWRKLKNDPRWICHHCHSHGCAPLSKYECTFEEWQEQVVKSQRLRVMTLIKEKDPKYYDECYFYDDEESVKRHFCGDFKDSNDAE